MLKMHDALEGITVRKHMMVQGAVRRLGGVAVAGLCLAAAARPSPQVSARPATGETRAATLDFVVVSRDGQPITDLRMDEVTLRIDGRLRPLRRLEFVRYASTPADGGGGIAEPFATNVPPAPSRAVLLVVDDESMPIGQERRLREAITEFVAGLAPADRVGVATVPSGGVRLDLTNDRESVRRVINAILPITPTRDASCRAVVAMGTLRQIFDELARRADQPVIVVLFSSAMAGPSQIERGAAPAAASGAGGLSAAAGACQLQTEDFTSLGAAAAAARVQLYVVHPDYNPTPATTGIESLRGVTGAPMLHLTSSGPESGLPRIGRETPGFYLATFDPESGERLDVPHQVSLRVTRRDADVRVRPTLMYGRLRQVVEAAPAYATAFDVVRSGRQFSELGLRVATVPTLGPDTSVNVITVFEPVDPGVAIVSASAALIDERGRGQAYWTGEAADLTSWPASVGLTVAPGRYRLRLAAIDASGRYGVVDAEVVAELVPAGPLALGGLAFGVSRSGGFLPRLVFASEASALVHVEITGGTPGLPVSAVFEVSDTTDGPALFRVPGVLSPTPTEGRVVATGTITVGILPPGDYVIRAIVGTQGEPAGRVIRTLRKLG